MSGPSSRAPDAIERPRAVALLLGALALAVGGCSKSAGSGGGDARGDGPRKGEPLRVAAASGLALAFKDVGAAFEDKTHKRVVFSFGSTGLLAKQITEGAPYDVFAAADVSFVDDVVREGACLEATRALYARGRIVLWSNDPAALPKDLKDLEAPRYTKIALANPEHAPYGRAGREALTKIGAWSSVQPRVVYGENIQQTLMFARSGNADVAIVALSLAVTSPGHYVPIDPSLHAPLDQELVICNGGSNGSKTHEARAFVDFVDSAAGRAIMRRYGFALPGEP